jgi:activator of HSP90 ATPase
MERKKSTITQKVIVPATPDEVYNVFMDPKKHSEFTGSRAEGKSIVGGEFTAWDGYIHAKILELEKGKKIVQEWVTTEWPKDFPPSKLELTFKDLGGKTEITMVHSDVPLSQEADLKQGWIDFYWKPLTDYFEKRKGTAKKQQDP